MTMRRLARPLARVGAASAAGAAGVALWLGGARDEYLAIEEDALPHKYMPLEIATVWREHPRCAIARTLEIGAAAVPFVLRLALDAATVSTSTSAEQREELHRTRATELRHLLVGLGPAFIKSGQMLSIRPDLLPPAAVYELQKLCDAVPSYPTADALRLIESELGVPASEVFTGLDESSQPIAAASLGQVYRCRMREGGEEVALKVQRPGLHAQIGADALLMRTAAAVVQWTISIVDALASLGASRQAKRTDLVAFVDEIVDSLGREIDYELEADSCERFHALYCGAGCLVEGIAAPRVLRHLSGPEVLCLTWMKGERLADAAARERAAAAPGGTRDSRGLSGAMVEQLLDRGVRFSLQSMLLDGFFHADPHPGNMLVVPRAGAGAAGEDDARHFDLVFLDFGMMGELPRTARIGLLGVVVHLWQLHDVALRAAGRTAAARELAEALSAIGFVAPNSGEFIFSYRYISCESC